MRGWIDVKKEAPPLDERVLVVVYGLNHPFSNPTPVVREGSFDGEHWHITDATTGSIRIEDSYVEYWQHFIKPPINNKLFRAVYYCLNPFDSWIASAIFFLFILGFVFMLNAVMQTNSQYKEAKAAYTTMLTCKKTKQAISQTLQITYNLSSYSSDGYAEIFYAASKRYCIDWEYFAALTYIESRYNQTLRSHAGACGLMQLLEPTAEQTCRKLRIPYQKNITIWNSFINLALGCAYFAEGKGSKENPKSMDDVIRHYNPMAKDSEYLDPLMKEHTKLTYIYRGVCKDFNL